MLYKSPESTSYHIGVDLMGSDTAPHELMYAVFDCAEKLPPSIHITLLATDPILHGVVPPFPHLSLKTVQEYITMEDAPLSAIRTKRNSSICRGIQMLQERQLHAFISAGNTGALMGAAKLFLPMLPGIARPALLTLLPTRHHAIAVLDVGANTTSKAEHLVEFALMGEAFQKMRGIDKPKIALLNIGSEPKKGTPELKLAYRKLEEMREHFGLHFVGNIEARDVFQGEIDVLITDGFTGNIFLKTAEGIGGVILDHIAHTAQEEGLSHLQASLNTLRHRLHYAEYPGAILCGIDGVVMKCHGNASAQSLTNTILCSIELVQGDFITQVRRVLSPSQNQAETFQY